MSNPLFPNHKPEDADLSNIPGYKGHPGQDRVKPDLNSQQQHSAMGYAQKSKEADEKIANEEQSRIARNNSKFSEKKDNLEDEFVKVDSTKHHEKDGKKHK